MSQAEINRLRALPVSTQSLIIGGKHVMAADEAMLDVISPIDGKVFTRIARASALDTDKAVLAARKSFESGIWSRAAPSERKKVMHRIADLIEKHALELAVLGVRDNGTEISMALKAEPGSAAGTFRYYAECVDKVYGEVAPTAHNILGLVHREPVGVVAAIVPCNFPRADHHRKIPRYNRCHHAHWLAVHKAKDVVCRRRNLAIDLVNALGVIAERARRATRLGLQSHGDFRAIIAHAQNSKLKRMFLNQFRDAVHDLLALRRRGAGPDTAVEAPAGSLHSPVRILHRSAGNAGEHFAVNWRNDVEHGFIRRRDMFAAYEQRLRTDR